MDSEVIADAVSPVGETAPPPTKDGLPAGRIELDVGKFLTESRT